MGGGLLAPGNLFFELPLLLAIVLTIIQLVGGLEAGHDLHVGADHVGSGSFSVNRKLCKKP